MENITILLYAVIAFMAIILIILLRLTSILGNTFSNTPVQNITLYDSIFEYLIKVYSVKLLDFGGLKISRTFKKLVKSASKVLENVEVEVIEDKDKKEKDK